MTELRAPEESTLRVRGLPTAENRWTVQGLNCDSPLTGAFCATCGQRAAPPHPTIREVAGDAFGELSGWDGKVAETFRLLLRQPGELTRQWIAGKRISFIAPLRLYLIASLVYFIVLAGVPNIRPVSSGVEVGGMKFGVTKDGKPAQVSEAASQALQAKQGLTGAERDSALAGIATAPAFMRPMLTRAIEDPQGFTNSISRAMANVLLGLVPVLGLILSLFYRRRHYPEHLFFAMHLATFVFIARTFGNLALFTRSVPITAVVQVVMLLWIVAYGVIALRRVYGGTIPMTILKGLGVCVLYGLVAAPLILGVVLWAAR